MAVWVTTVKSELENSSVIYQFFPSGNFCQSRTKIMKRKGKLKLFLLGGPLVGIFVNFGSVKHKNSRGESEDHTGKKSRK